VAIATLYKLLSVMNADVSESFKMVVVIISMASMSVGIMALRQTNVKRMLAFSGISHAGFMLMTLLSLSTSSLLYYTAAYSLSGIAAFSVILYVCKIEIMKMW
jgi:NADH-quinone oxidoreductase subunit N